MNKISEIIVKLYNFTNVYTHTSLKHIHYRYKKLNLVINTA